MNDKAHIYSFVLAFVLLAMDIAFSESLFSAPMIIIVLSICCTFVVYYFIVFAIIKLIDKLS